MENGGASCTVGENVNGAATVGTVQQFLKKLKIKPSYNLAILFWTYIQGHETKCFRDSFILLLIAVLLTIARTQK